MTSPNAPLTALVFLGSFAAAASTPRPAAADSILPTTATVPCGTVIAHGNELQPPFSLALEGDTLIVAGAGGRSLASPLPAAGAGPDGTSPSVRLAQLTHLLASGGLLAFGSSYAVVFPPARAREVLAHLRWVTDGAPHLGGFLPQDDPLIRDLLRPAPLAEPDEDEENTADERTLSGDASS